jgi:HD domain
MARQTHLVRRFFGALWPAAPKAPDTAWVATVLNEREFAVWKRMPNHDRRHSIRVARDAEAMLAGTQYAGDTCWVEAALLHDIGKLDAGLGVFSRVAATPAGAAAGHEMADAWSEKKGITRRFGLYLRHPELGASRIRMCEGSNEAALWAEAHQDPDLWATTGLPETVITALSTADDD